MSLKHLLLAAAALGAGCGSSTSAGLAEYSQLTLQLSSAVAAHRDAGTSVSSVSDCTSEHANYDGHARPLVEQMLSISGQMDSCMMGLGNAALANFQRTCRSMISELDSHAQKACQSSTMSQDWSETVRDCDAMDAFIQREQSGEDTMSNMMRGMMTSGACHP